MSAESSMVPGGMALAPWRRKVRAWLVLGRISNLPTVWSNCLAAWLLGGGGPWGRLAIVVLGASLLYTAGMFLNDAFDVEFDRQYRPERPIVSGLVGAGSVWFAGGLLMALGLLAVWTTGSRGAFYGLVLVATITAYDVVHKKTALAPLLMAGCRFLLYLVGAAAAQKGSVTPVLWPAVGLACYIVGLSYLARRESTSPASSSWPKPFLLIPIVLALTFSSGNGQSVWIAAAVSTAWVFWCIASPKSWRSGFVPRGIAGLLAGIVWVDWLATAATAPGFCVVFLGLFVLAVLAQRLAPAT